MENNLTAYRNSKVVIWLVAFCLVAAFSMGIAGRTWLRPVDALELMASAVAALIAVVGFIWFQRDHSTRRWRAALDAYAEREIARDRRRRLPPIGVQFNTRNNPGWKDDRPGKSAIVSIPGFQRYEAATTAIRGTFNGLKDRLAAELTDVAYPMALRQGVQGFSVDVELDIWRAIYGTLQEMPDPFLISAPETMRLWDDALARLTDAAYKVALLRGFRGTFVDFELRLWDAFHEELPSAV
jgi:hypothetical protein